MTWLQSFKGGNSVITSPLLLFFVGPIVCGISVFGHGLSDVDIWAFSRLAITSPRGREMVACM